MPTGLSTELRDHVECPRNTCVAIGYECPRSSDAGVAWDVSSLVGPPPSGRAHKPTYERGEWGPSTWPPTGASIGLSVVGIFHGHETTMADPPPASSRREVRHSGRKGSPRLGTVASVQDGGRRAKYNAMRRRAPSRPPVAGGSWPRVARAIGARPPSSVESRPVPRREG